MQNKIAVMPERFSISAQHVGDVSYSNFLALLVQKYKYYRKRRSERLGASASV
jgi:hypothetical protein